MNLQAILQNQLSERFPAVKTISIHPVGGGSINECYQIKFNSKSIFCKVNSATKFPHLFSREKSGLEFLSRQQIIHTPAVIDCFEKEDKQFLLLEWIQTGERTEHFWKKFGEQLAALHHVSDPLHGWIEDNYMGSVPQKNNRHQLWSLFFATGRLLPMIERCAAKKLLHQKHLDQFEALAQKLPGIFEEEPPSLLHGDLWSGNFMCNAAAEPVLIDPAAYFGHRSMDLAMTTLFGGFRQPFYNAYHYHFPLPANHQEQWAVCNLYPLLIHLYLFGTGYLAQIESTLKKFA